MTVQLRRAPRCQHVHVSGRRCANPAQSTYFVLGDERLCPDHKGANDTEHCVICGDLMRAFVPPKGW